MIDPMTTLAFSMYENKGVYALLLGSGVSRAAQIPTGWEITLDLARRVAALEGVTDRDDWAAWYAERFGEPADYSKLLDALSTTAAERRAILHSYIEPSDADLETGARQPTKAHHAIARIVRDGHARVIVTTNFDRLLENALREAGVEPTVIKSEDDLAGAVPLVHARCFILKVHGDYLDTRLLNTDAELAAYGDAQNRYLDRLLDEHGLLICGWSGDWDPALRAAIARTPSRRYPVFWAARGTPSAIAEDLIAQRGARPVNIADADSFFADLQQHLETLAMNARPHPLSADLFVGTAKRFLARSDHRIQLADLLHAEVARARDVAAAKGMGPQGNFSETEFRERLAAYEAIYEPLGRVGLAMGRWGDDEEFALARDILLALAQAQQVNGLVIWLKLMTYPAALFFSAYALGAAKAGRYATLRSWLQIPVHRERRQQEEPAFDVLFGEMWEGGDRDLWNLLDPSVKRYTPFNDYLLTVLQRWGGKEFLDEADVELSFEWLELLVGIEMTMARTNKAQLEALIETAGGKREFLWSTIGRLSWHYDNQERLLKRMVGDPTAAALMAAGFAGGERDVLDLLDQNFRRVIDRRGWR